jgi:RimJ/RimL family protein N-acetyltransferase
MAERLERLGVVPEAVILAKNGHHYVGYACLDPRSSGAVSLRQSWTGVRPSHRGRGIGTALKALGIEYAQAHGYQRIETEARVTNVASMRMSLKVGYVRAEPARETTSR